MVLVMVDQVILSSVRLLPQNNFTIEEFFLWLTLEETLEDHNSLFVITDKIHNTLTVIILVLVKWWKGLIS